MNYQEAYEEGTRRLILAQIADAELDARYLLEEVCQTDRTALYVHKDRTLSENEKEKYLAGIGRREQHEPLQQILGFTEFMGLRFLVTNQVLCPRQDTEILVEEVMRYLQDGSRILDMCTGSGCILLSLLHYSNQCIGTGADISPEALSVARQNADNLELEAAWIQSDLFEKISGEYEYIVSNPPYIPEEELKGLMPEVRDHEPYIALSGLEDGLFYYHSLIPAAREHLCGGGMLFLEIGYQQAEDVTRLMQESGYREITVKKDLAGLDRVVYGMR